MFDQLGYFKEYFIENKFIGSLTCEKDREAIGYYGRKTEITSGKVTLDNGKNIKANTTVTTILYPLCGKKTN